MKIVAGHWQYKNDAQGYYAPPAGCFGGIDLAPIAEQGVIASSRPGGLFFAPDGTPTPDHTVIAQGGDPRELTVTARMRDAFQSHFGFRPAGERLPDLIADVLTTGADPFGAATPKPLMPTSNRKLQLALPGIGVVRQDKFTMSHPLANKVVQVWRQGYRQAFEAAQSGEMSLNFHRRMLDHACEQFRTNDWQSLLPVDLRQHVAGRLPHSTIYQESFNTADSDTLGPDLTWTEVTTDIDIVSNKAQSVTNAASVVARADHDLSSANHYVQSTLSMSNEGAASDVSIMARKDSSSTLTFMAAHYRGDTDTVSIYRVSAGTYTQIAVVSVTIAASTDYLTKLVCDGSGFVAYLAGNARTAITDTTISSGTRCGIRAFMSSGNAKWDDWSASDQITTAYPTIIRKSNVLCKM